MSKVNGMNALTFNYNGQAITFRKGDSVMVNATEMAKSFGKQPKDWLRLQSTKELITSLSAVRQISLTGLILVNQGGSNQGTWMHEDVALEFARWLSPQFAIWCNDRIKELLTTGMTATPQTLEAMLANPDLVIGLATQLKELRSANEALQLTNAELAPKAKYTDEVLQSTSGMTFTEVAKELGYRSAKAFLDKLVSARVLYRQSGRYLPMAKYSDKGYFSTRTHRFYHSDGRPDCSVMTVVTQKGRAFLNLHFNNN